jgi:RNA polymerase sigma-70 factor, ECF subfamily
VDVFFCTRRIRSKPSTQFPITRVKSQVEFFTSTVAIILLVAQLAKKVEGTLMLATEVQTLANTLDSPPRSPGNECLRDERWLVARAKSGHEDAFGELYERQKLKAYRTAVCILHNRQDAEDAVQRAFQRALVNLQRFREDSTFSTWLTRITINEALMLLRQRRKREPLHENGANTAQADGGVEIVDDGPTPEEILCESERRAALHHAIGRLRNNQRMVVLFVELQGLTSAETARRLGLTVSAVKARIFHARRFLKRHLERSVKGSGTVGRWRIRKPRGHGKAKID